MHHEQDACQYWKLAEGGYAGRMSVRQGESLTLHISNSRSYFDVFIYREGAERKWIKTINNLSGALQGVPETGYQDGFDWPVSVELVIPDDWESGVYIAAFGTAQGPREILFVVRPREPRSPLLLTLAINTYAAYNNVGGKCFYDYISTDGAHSKVVSFERPLQPTVLGNFHIWDQFFTSWLDAEGYEVDYGINLDIENEPDLLSAYTANLRIGHDEYNTRRECACVQQFVRSGGNMLLFAGNSFYHEVEYRSHGRQLLCPKRQYRTPPTPRRTETSFLNRIDNLRQDTIGVNYTTFVHAKTDAPGVYAAPTTGPYGYYTVADADHWLFAGTGLVNGDVFGQEDSIVGVEADGALMDHTQSPPVYTGADGVSPEYHIVATAAGKIPENFLSLDGSGTDELIDAHSTIAINESEFKGTVFNAATVEWGHGLYRDNSPVARMTRNVLDRLAR